MPKDPRTKYNIYIDRLIILLAYGCAFLVAWYVVVHSPGTTVVRVAWADVAATAVIFIFSMIFKNSSIYDPYWSVAPIVIAFYWCAVSWDLGDNTRRILILIVTSIWGIRLTLNWWRGWRGLLQEDWRYRDIALKTGKFYWVVSFMGIHLFPTIIVFLGCLPMIPAMCADLPVNRWDFVAFVVALGAAAVELTADEQMKTFRNSSGNRSRVCDIGLWRYSRHPNYFGEITFWLGILIFALGIDIDKYLWTGIGFVAMVLLFLTVSIPMMEKRQKQKAGYEEYQRQVPILIPLPRKLKK